MYELELPQNQDQSVSNLREATEFLSSFSVFFFFFKKGGICSTFPELLGRPYENRWASVLPTKLYKRVGSWPWRLGRLPCADRTWGLSAQALPDTDIQGTKRRGRDGGGTCRPGGTRAGEDGVGTGWESLQPAGPGGRGGGLRRRREGRSRRGGAPGLNLFPGALELSQHRKFRCR